MATARDRWRLAQSTNETRRTVTRRILISPLRPSAHGLSVRARAPTTAVVDLRERRRRPSTLVIPSRNKSRAVAGVVRHYASPRISGCTPPLAAMMEAADPRKRNDSRRSATFSSTRSARERRAARIAHTSKTTKTEKSSAIAGGLSASAISGSRCGGQPTPRGQRPEFLHDLVLASDKSPEPTLGRHGASRSGLESAWRILGDSREPFTNTRRLV